MRKSTVLVLAGLLMVGILGQASVASAKRGEVVKSGSCSGASSWKMKLSPDNGRIEAEFEVDQNVSGDTWKVRMKHDGVKFFAGKRTTHGASGSFDVHRFQDGNPGKDAFKARATNLSTGEVCRASASI